MLSEFEGYWKAWMKKISDYLNYSRHRRSTRSGVHLNAPASQVDQLGRRRFCHPRGLACNFCHLQSGTNQPTQFVLPQEEVATDTILMWGPLKGLRVVGHALRWRRQETSSGGEINSRPRALRPVLSITGCLVNILTSN